jgi:hypothetical protein
MGLGASGAARWQAYQTRARMGARVWLAIVKFALLSWLAATLWAVWHETAEYFPAFGHRYFGRWALSWLFTDIPFINGLGPWLRLEYRGRWYPLPGMYAFLNGPHFYRASFGFWCRHFCRYTAVVPLTAGAAMMALKLRRGGGAEHVRGLRLLPARRLNAQLAGGVWSRLGRAFARAAFVAEDPPAPLRIGAVLVPAKREAEHFLITGSPGAGKSTLIRRMLKTIAARGQIAVVADPEGEYAQEFYDPARGDAILNPLDQRCPCWSPWFEFRPELFEMDAAALAASLVRGQPNASGENSSQAFFRQSSRALLEAIFRVAQPRHPRAISALLALPRDRLKEAIAGTPAEPLVDPKAHDQGAGIVAMAANAINPFEYLPKPEETTRTWSARGWAELRRGWLFLSSSEDSRQAVQPLQAVWLDLIVRWLLAAPIGNEQVWVVVDELPVLNYQPQLEQLATRGRKRGLCAVMGFQNISQLRAIYGRDRTTTMISAPATKVILRCDEAETAEWASEQLGKREAVRVEMTALTGLSNYREGVNLQPRRTTEAIVMAAEVQRLKELEGYVCMAGNDRARITIPPAWLECRQPAFLPRLGQAIKPAADQTAADAGGADDCGMAPETEKKISYGPSPEPAKNSLAIPKNGWARAKNAPRAPRKWS